MENIELLEKLKREATDYRKNAQLSLLRNKHMNDIKENEIVEQRIIDAVLVDFINCIAYGKGIDYGLYTSDLGTLPPY